MKKTLNMKFMEELSRCRDVMTFVGLLRMFEVPFVEKKENEEGAEEVNPSPTGEILPDMDDLVFFEVVMEKSDDAYLITGNLKHYPSREFIVTPAEMMSIISPDETSKAP